MCGLEEGTSSADWTGNQSRQSALKMKKVFCPCRGSKHGPLIFQPVAWWLHRKQNRSSGVERHAMKWNSVVEKIYNMKFNFSFFECWKRCVERMSGETRLPHSDIILLHIRILRNRFSAHREDVPQFTASLHVRSSTSIVFGWFKWPSPVNEGDVKFFSLFLSQYHPH